jgi:iron complex transport system ATP-binding protein
MRGKKILQVNNVSAGYGRHIVLRDISFSVEKGEFLGILGPNGSGKSTLLKVLSRVIPPLQGDVLFENNNITDLRPRELAQKIAFVAQETVINFPFTVWEIVLMGRIPFVGKFQLETKRDFNFAQEALAAVNSLDLRDSNITQLSAGERQRVIIAKALCQQPILLFLDEPTAHLDISYKVEILNLLKQLNENKNLTVIIVLHDLNLASQYCNRIILLKDGRLVCDGDISEVLTKINIDKVYNTEVVLDRHPFTSRPLILLSPKKDIKNKSG